MDNYLRIIDFFIIFLLKKTLIINIMIYLHLIVYLKLHLFLIFINFMTILITDFHLEFRIIIIIITNLNPPLLKSLAFYIFHVSL